MLSLFQVIGTIPPPSPLSNFDPVEQGGLGQLINLFIYIIIVVAGLYALFNLLLAGYAFMSAGDDPKKMAAAWGKIYQTVLGLVVVAGAFVLAAIFGWLIYGRFNALLTPTIPSI